MVPDLVHKLQIICLKGTYVIVPETKCRTYVQTQEKLNAANAQRRGHKIRGTPYIVHLHLRFLAVQKMFNIFYFQIFCFKKKGGNLLIRGKLPSFLHSVFPRKVLSCNRYDYNACTASITLSSQVRRSALKGIVVLLNGI